MTLSKNQDIELYIESFTSEGSGVGHIDGMAVFVSGAAAGDKALVHIIKVKKNYAIGKAVKILKPSQSRIAVDCESFPSCGGCAFRHISYEAELEMKKQKVENAFKRLGGINKEVDEIIGGSITGYRNKAEYPVSFDRKLNIGFYALHTHRIVNCESCALQPEIFSEIVKTVRKWIAEYGISVYDAEKGTGLLRHIYIRQAAVTKQIMVCLVINGESMPKSDILIERLRKTEDIKSIVINMNTEKTNVILGKSCVTLWGDNYIYDELCGVKIRLSPLSFYQVNHAQAQKLYEKAAEYAGLTGNEILLDMYCGAGTIGLSMANRCKKVIGVEIVRPAVEDAKYNAEINGIKNAEFYCADASNAAEMFKNKGIKPDVIVIDPPRKGCERSLIETVCKMSPERVVYVSCDCATLARDCKIFETLGYKAEKLTAVDLFPRTVHVETVCLLTRKQRGSDMKINEFFENAQLLSEKLGIVPLMYGSLGLEYLTGENLNADDIDILIPEAFLSERWNELKGVLEENGYILIDGSEHTFEKNGLHCSYASIEELESFADISVSDISLLKQGEVSFRLLSLEQYLNVYTASAKDGYRVEVRHKKDSDKIKFIQSQIHKETESV